MTSKKFTALILTLVVSVSALIILLSPSASADGSIPTAYPPEGLEGELPYCTSVKDQNPHGTCWAFSAVACAEADAIKNHGADKNEIDLSEWHLAYFTYSGLRDGTGDEVSLTGDYEYYMLGGHELYAALTLSAGIGFADESIAPYEELKKNGNATIDPSLMYESDYRISNVFFYDVTKDADKIKAAVLEYGAASVSYHGSSQYLDPATRTSHYCYDKTKKADHAVTVIGWDDGYSALNFGSDNTPRPKNDGAWLVKNSWGDGVGRGGYFWISYEDVSLTGGTVYDVIPADTYDRIYQHDGGVSTQYITCQTDDEIVNIFKTDENSSSVLTAVSICTVSTQTEVDYELKIYGGVSYEGGQLLYEELLLSQNGSLKHNFGYITVALDKPVLLDGFDTFAVSVTANTGILIDGDYSENPKDGALFTSSTTVLQGQTVYNENGSGWRDASTDPKPWNARIKALAATSIKHLIPEVTVAPTVRLTYTDGELTDCSITSGQVSDPNTNNTVFGSWRLADNDIDYRDGDTAELIFIPEDTEKYGAVRISVQVTVDMTEADTEEETDTEAETETEAETDTDTEAEADTEEDTEDAETEADTDILEDTETGEEDTEPQFPTDPDDPAAPKEKGSLISSMLKLVARLISDYGFLLILAGIILACALLAAALLISAVAILTLTAVILIVLAALITLISTVIIRKRRHNRG